MDDVTTRAQRIWRLRRLHQLVDAELHLDAGGVELRFLYNGMVTFRQRWPDRHSAIEAAATKRAELEREGWMFHW